MAKKFSGAEIENLIQPPATQSTPKEKRPPKPGKSKSIGKARKPGKAKGFDIEADTLPEAIVDAAYHSGNYPYGKRMKRKRYNRELEPLQI